MPTLDEMISETIDLLLSGQRDVMNRLDGAVAQGAATLALVYELEEIAKGAVISVDLERIRVWDTDGTANSVTGLERGVEGTTDVAHSNLATVFVNARFDKFKVLRAINEEIGSLSASGLYRMSPLNITYESGISGYDLTGVTLAEFLGIYDIRAETNSNSEYWPEITDYEWSTDLAATEFASSIALFLHQGAYADKPMRVRYKRTLGLFGTTSAALGTDFATVTGLRSEAKDLVIYGAQARLMASREARRAHYDAQPDPRRSEEVPVGTQMASASGLLKLWKMRLEAEKKYLMKRYPPKRRVSR